MDVVFYFSSLRDWCTLIVLEINQCLLLFKNLFRKGIKKTLQSFKCITWCCTFKLIKFTLTLMFLQLQIVCFSRPPPLNSSCEFLNLPKIIWRTAVLLLSLSGRVQDMFLISWDQKCHFLPKCTILVWDNMKNISIYWTLSYSNSSHLLSDYFLNVFPDL